MKAFEIAGVPRDEVQRFVRGLHSDPFSVLGPHKVGDDVEIRVFRPDARAVEVVLDREPDKAIAAERIDEEGFFCATVPGAERRQSRKLSLSRTHPINSAVMLSEAKHLCSFALGRIARKLIRDSSLRSE